MDGQPHLLRRSLSTNPQPLMLQQWEPPERTQPDPAAPGPIDARGANWSGRVLPAIDLTNAKLCRSDLRGSDLSQCSLEGADLRLARYDSATCWPEGFDYCSSGAVGPGARLSGVYLNNADLRGMDLRGSVLMGTYLSGYDLSGAILDGVRLAGADLRSAVLRGASCMGTRFGNAQLDFADFRGAELTDASLENIESIRGADFSGAHGVEAFRSELLRREPEELDCWNPLTRSTTRLSLDLQAQQ